MSGKSHKEDEEDNDTPMFMRLSKPRRVIVHDESEMIGCLAVVLVILFALLLESLGIDILH